jgi:hypothetical protein
LAHNELNWNICYYYFDIQYHIPLQVWKKCKESMLSVLVRSKDAYLFSR